MSRVSLESTEGIMDTVRLMLWGVLMAALPAESGTAQPRIASEEMPRTHLPSSYTGRVIAVMHLLPPSEMLGDQSQMNRCGC